MIKRPKRTIPIERIEDALLNLITFGLDYKIRLKSINYLIQNKDFLPPAIQMQLRTLQYGNISQQTLRLLVISLLFQLDISRSFDHLSKLLLNPRESHYAKNAILDSLLKDPKPEFIESVLIFIYQRSNYSDLRSKAIWFIIYTNRMIGLTLIKELLQNTHEELLIQKTIIQACGFLLEDELVQPLLGFLKNRNPMLNQTAHESLLKFSSEKIFTDALREYKNSSSLYHQIKNNHILRP